MFDFKTSDLKDILVNFSSIFSCYLKVSVAGSYGSVEKFTITPKDKEVFVGGSVQFDWDYAFTDVSEVRFGLADREHFTDVAIYVKLRNGTLKFNHMSESVKWIRKRVEVVPNRRASFKINSVQMDDSKTFFCLCIRGALKPMIRDYVKLSVVGKIRSLSYASFPIPRQKLHALVNRQLVARVKLTRKIPLKAH